MDKLLHNFCDSLKNLSKLNAMADLTNFMEGETAFLYTLKNFGEKPATPSVLSEELNVTKGRITAIINSLSRKEMIKLEQIKGDRRKINVRITEKGNAYIEKKLESINEILVDFIKRMGRAETEHLIDLMNRAGAALGSVEVEERNK